jgi:hypothetical protein
MSVQTRFSAFRRTHCSCTLSQRSITTKLTHRLKAPDITDVPTLLPTILKKTMMWFDLLQYFRTSGDARNFQDKHPEDMRRSDGDISERLLLQLVRSVEEREGCRIKPEEDLIQVEWPLGFPQARMRQ